MERNYYGRNNNTRKNKTQDVTDLPKRKIPFDCKWIFTIKYKANETIERYKTHVAAKRFTQPYSIDYTKTLAPMAKLNTVRVFLSLIATQTGLFNNLTLKIHFSMGYQKMSI